MRLNRIKPSAALQPYVKYLWRLEVENSDIPYSQQLFPFGAFELIFNLNGAPEMKIDGSGIFVQPHSIFTGQFTQPFLLQYNRPFCTIGATLQPWAGDLMQVCAAELTNRIIQLDDIDKGAFVREQLLEVENENEQFGILEAYLFGKIKQTAGDAVSACLAKQMMVLPSEKQFQKAIDSVGFSRRRVEQRFRQSVGLTMGTFLQKMRFQRAVSILQNESFDNLGDAGFMAGYYDQSHFIRHFKSFAGISPKQFIMQQSNVRNTVSQLM